MKRIIITKICIFFVFIISLSQSIFAQGAVFERVFDRLPLLMNNVYFVYTLTFILYFILLYAIYSSAAKYLKIFEDPNKPSGLNKSGKIFSVAASLITTLSLFYFGNRSITKLLQNLLDPFGIFGGLLIACVVFMIVYFGFRTADPNDNSWKIAMCLAGLGMVLAGKIASKPNISTWGWFIALIGLLIYLLSLLFSKSQPQKPEPLPPSEEEKKEDKKKEKTDNKEEKEDEKKEEESEFEEEGEWYPVIEDIDRHTNKLKGHVEEK